MAECENSFCNWVVVGLWLLYWFDVGGAEWQLSVVGAMCGRVFMWELLDRSEVLLNYVMLLIFISRSILPVIRGP